MTGLFVDALRRILPPWLSARFERALSVGFRYLAALTLALDAAADVLTQGLLARFPGLGTPTALELIGRSRALIRNQGESDEAYAARLRNWLEIHKEAGSQLQIARSIHEYLRTRPRVRVVNRAGRFVTVNADGSVEIYDGAWDWDSVSNPERNDPAEPWWSDLWVIVYTSEEQWRARPGGLGDLEGDDGFALGHLATREEVDAILGLLAQWKAQHSRIRAVIWCPNPSLFDPMNPATLPDGTWGDWAITVGGSCIASRNPTCRYWEPW